MIIFHEGPFLNDELNDKARFRVANISFATLSRQRAIARSNYSFFGILFAFIYTGEGAYLSVIALLFLFCNLCVWLYFDIKSVR